MKNSNLNEIRKEYGKALDLMGEGKALEASKVIEQILEKEDNFLEAYEGLAVLYSQLNRLDDAISLMKKLLEKDPEHIMAHTNLSIFYMKKGMKEEAEEWKAKATVLQFSKGSH